MSDADRIYHFGPLQSAAPDDWHDRQQAKRGTIRGALLCVGLFVAVVVAAVAVGVAG